MLNQHQTIRDNIQKYNQHLPLVDYLIPLISGKKNVKIADLGSGPYPTIGQYLDGVEVQIFSSDSQDFSDFWKKYKTTPLFHIEYQHMEDLTYPDNFFDVVHCANALDHTPGAMKAVEEMIRVCKPGGWIYIDCCLDQLSTGHKHFWDAKEDGWLINGEYEFDLKDFGFQIKLIDNGMETRYNHIIATLQKP